MSGAFEDKNRKIIPRWRPFSSPHTQRELDNIRIGERLHVSTESLERAWADWNEFKSISFASDLLSQGMALGELKGLESVARTVLATNEPFLEGAKSIAKRVLQENTNAPVLPPEPGGIFQNVAVSRINSLKSRLATEPRNPIKWIDLSLWYTILSQKEKARRAIAVALQLAPTNRFILRTAARFFVHIDEYAIAHDILRRSPIVRTDPWILAAEIATASVASRTSTNIKRGRELVEDRTVLPSQTSELASALGTLDAEAGDYRRARRLVKYSLISGTENSLAQAAWLERNMRITAISEVPQLGGVTSAEANAWNSYRAGAWSDAVEQCRHWLADQPFSVRPAILGSFVSSVIEASFSDAIEIAKTGLVANPTNFVLLNNCAFALAMSGRVDEAKTEFSRINTNSLSPDDEVVWHATNGLIQIRMGEFERGKTEYMIAITAAEGKRDAKRAALARLYLAMEDIRVNKRHAVTNARAVVDQIRALEYLDLLPVALQLENRISEIA